jgi:hypothetical protein
MASKVCAKRANGKTGNLVLPVAVETDQKEVVVNGIPVIAKFGDIFHVENDKCIPVIPNFWGGVLRSKLIQLSGREYDEITEKYQLVDTGIAEMPHAIMYIYDTVTHRLDDEFEEIAKLCPEGSTLIFPTIGVNNGIHYHTSAFNMFHSIISCLENEESSLRKLTKIVIMTIFNSDQDNNGVRTIRHIFNQMNIYNGTRTNKMCAICASVKVDTILSCGHFIVCSRCCVDIKHLGNVCPICKTTITETYPCCTVTDATDFACCSSEEKQEEKHKVKKICIPCCHINVACQECDKHIEEHMQCPVCKEEMVAYIPFFDC